ncbi:hypothetical protein [Streptomyces nigra]|uniref:hypothetical protein n=1 Tax=Streptomyces nigra TaxID=1827580 RepID=UPI000D526184|nr:hypothetical protein [Streptomyces nigra]AWE52874.1 hypothetical protein DC008_26400 [Streptomyces nigra]
MSAGRRLPTVLTAVAALALLPGCASGDDQPASSSSSASADGARAAVVAYVDALNSRSVARLIDVGGVADETWSRREAERILANRGGRGWRIEGVRVDLDMGPDTGSARLEAEDKAGRPLRDSFTVIREDGAWHLSFFTQQPAESDKESSSTDRPGT